MSDIELKSSLHKLVDKINNNSVLEAYLVLLAREVEREQENDFWLQLDDKTKSKIDQGMADMKNNNTVDALDFMKSTYGI